MGDSELDAALVSWFTLDRHGPTREAARKLVDAGDVAAVRAHFGKRMAFGTAGLRAAMGPGPARMNDLTVIQASQGLCAYLMETKSGAAAAKVAIGYDGRHNSKRFAARAAQAFLLRGCSVLLFSDICPTPYVPYAVTTYGCDAGIMVTASHNPKEDNGYKVYWGNGAQIVSPHDKNITAHIAANLEPWEGVWDEPSSSSSSSSIKDPLAEVNETYHDTIRKLSFLSAESKATSKLRITYTAMHGVGWRACERAYTSFGLQPFVPVPEQVEPNPDFPTVKYPNPEEGKGALECAIATAEANGSTLILANDPDADRLAVAVLEQRKSGGGSSSATGDGGGNWTVLSGNQIGSIFAWWLWTQDRRQNPDAAPADTYMIASAVSSKMLGTMARAEGFKFVETLTGFKWMGNKARDLMAAGKRVLFSYEEAIGFCCGTTVVDKDGVCASAVMGEIAVSLAAEGKTVLDKLDELYARYGYHANNASYFICREQSTIDRIFSKIRTGGSEGSKGYPSTIAGVAVDVVRDVTTGYDSSTPDNVSDLPVQSGHMITFTLANRCVITLRTSGTEPKIKYYAELIGDAKSIEERSKVDAELAAFVDKAVEQMLEPKVNGLVPKAG